MVVEQLDQHYAIKLGLHSRGKLLSLTREATREGLQQALRLAMERYGSSITVNGTTEFKAQTSFAPTAAAAD